MPETEEKKQDAQEQPKDGTGSELAKVIAESKAYRKRAQASEQDVADLKAQINDLLKVKEDADAKVEQDLLVKKGEFEKALEAERAKFAKLIAERDNKIQGLTTSINDLAVTNRLIDLLGKAGVAPDRLSAARKLIAGDIKSSLGADGKIAITITEDDGSQFDTSEPDVLAAYVKQWVGGNMYFLPPSRDSGSGERKGGERSIPKTRKELLADPKATADFISQHGKQAFYDLPNN